LPGNSSGNTPVFGIIIFRTTIPARGDIDAWYPPVLKTATFCPGTLQVHPCMLCAGIPSGETPANTPDAQNFCYLYQKTIFTLFKLNY